MADFASALYSRLTGDGPIAAVVGTRIYWTIVPQNTVKPYIRLQTISDARPAHLQGYDGARQTRVQADCFAATYGTARQLAEKVITAVSAPETVGGVQFGWTKAEGPRDLGEDVAGTWIHRASIDLLVEHRLA